jgi:indolepyruvate ferredoxin oxidoreductase alpha subunit
MTGFEAIALSCHESGVQFGSGYPGFPCIEIIEQLKRYENVYCEWSTTEKVAFEAAIGASLMGKRAVVSMKTVGLNVAADPFYAFSGSKVNGGFLLFACDDVGRLAGDDMNDSREYAFAADIPLIVPGDAQEAYDFIPEALNISEKFNTPVFMRLSSVVTHTGMVVGSNEGKKHINTRGFNPKEHGYVPKTITSTIATLDKDTLLYKKMSKKYVDWAGRNSEMKKYVNKSALNKTEYGCQDIGFICSGTTYNFVKEVFPEASFLRLGMINPVPDQLIKEFAAKVKNVFVLEESKPLLEKRIQALGVDVKNGNIFPREAAIFKMEPTIIKNRIAAYFKNEDIVEATETRIQDKIPYRLPVNCAGCSHRNVFYLLKKLGLKVMGDSGCYTLNLFPPMENVHNFICMGSGIGLMHGYEKGMATIAEQDKVVAVSGDGAFLHTGINSLMNVAFNAGKSVYIILDNHGLSMTGGHGTPSNGKNVNGRFSQSFDIENFCKVLGIDVVKLDPYNLAHAEEVIKEKVNMDKAAVIIMDHPCSRLYPKETKERLKLDKNSCISCGQCLQTNCLALSREDNRERITPSLDSDMCKLCGVCEDICPSSSFYRVISEV